MRPCPCKATGTRLEEHAAAHDHYTPLAEHFRLLTDARFKDPDCVWRDGMYTVVSGQR